MSRQSMVPQEYMLVDIDTQRDLLTAGGKCCVKNHRRILACIRRIMAWVRFNHIAVISTCEAYPGNSNGQHRCINGTEGQEKIRYTLLENRCSLPIDTSTDIPIDLFHCYQQIILPKRCVDPFKEPRIGRLLDEVQVDKFILVGAIAEGSVLLTALGLLQRGKKVVIVADALGKHNNRDAKLALRKMSVKGARLIEAKMLAGVSNLRQVGICHCHMCKSPRAVTVAL